MSEIGFGAWAFVGDWGATDDVGSLAAMHAAVDAGALQAIDYAGVATVQIVFNVFRQRPARLFFEEARRRDVGLIVRVPLASGLLTGKLTRDSRFAPDDHREFNRRGETFDVGETLAGIDFARGREAVDALRPLVPDGITMAHFDALFPHRRRTAYACTMHTNVVYQPGFFHKHLSERDGAGRTAGPSPDSSGTTTGVQRRSSS